MTDFTDRQREVLELLPLGKTNAEIGKILGLSGLTVKNHVQNVMRKLGVCNRFLAATVARQIGLIPDRPINVPIAHPEPELPVPVVHLGDEEAAAIGGMTLYTSGRVVINGRDYRMARKEYDLLRFFVQHLGRTYSREQILNCVWGEDVALEPRTVDAHIKRLRNVLPADCPYVVETVRQYGYRLVERV